MTRKDFLSKMALSVAAVAAAPQVCAKAKAQDLSRMPIQAVLDGIPPYFEKGTTLVEKRSLVGRFIGIDVPNELKMQLKPSDEEILNETGPVPDGYYIGERYLLWVDHRDGTGHWFSQCRAIPDGMAIEDFKDRASIYVLA